MQQITLRDVIAWYGTAEDGAIARVVLDPALAFDLADRWPERGLHAGPVVAGAHGDARDSGFDLDLVLAHRNDLHRIESDLGLFAVAHLSHLVAVHAALLVCDGQAVLVPGMSFTGKSTLALAAARVGIIVASDEYALIDPNTGLAVGVPRPVRERVAAGIRRIDIAQPTAPVPIQLVAALSWHVGQPHITAISPSGVVMEVLANTVCAQARPRASFDAAVAVARTARGIGGHRGEAAATVGLLASTVAA